MINYKIFMTLKRPVNSTIQIIQTVRVHQFGNNKNNKKDSKRERITEGKTESNQLQQNKLYQEILEPHLDHMNNLNML
ncbi:MAG: hypothetical protein COW85_10195 [Ignavibacteria bacterium CG22_combo_CG10-13_8_21_14_all_37_15]|nr:MAG: hypothetical protein COW85_10195 [Ignavibacteria bacterium CG22_combo_CG10-13_8_21_14_all_37_15]